jgi:hypothetical protein
MKIEQADSFSIGSDRHTFQMASSRVSFPKSIGSRKHAHPLGSVVATCFSQNEKGFAQKKAGIAAGPSALFSGRKRYCLVT